MTEIVLHDEPFAPARRRHPRLGYAMATAAAALFAVNGTVSKIILTSGGMTSLRLTELRATGAFVGLAGDLGQAMERLLDHLGIDLIGDGLDAAGGLGHGRLRRIQNLAQAVGRLVQAGDQLTEPRPHRLGRTAHLGDRGGAELRGADKTAQAYRRRSWWIALRI